MSARVTFPKIHFSFAGIGLMFGSLSGYTLAPHLAGPHTWIFGISAIFGLLMGSLVDRATRKFLQRVNPKTTFNNSGEMTKSWCMCKKCQSGLE